MDPTFGNNTWPGIEAALKSDTPCVAILPCGATEAHGKHLPLNTDVVISDGVASYALPDLEDADMAGQRTGETFRRCGIGYIECDNQPVARGKGRGRFAGHAIPLCVYPRGRR